MPVNAAESMMKDIHKRFAALSNRITQLETTEPHQQIGSVHAVSFAVNGVVIAGGASLSSYGIAGSNGVPTNATGVFLQVSAVFLGAGQLQVSADHEIPDQYSGRLVATGASTQSGLIMVKLSPAGGIKFLNTAAGNCTVSAAVTGWFK